MSKVVCIKLVTGEELIGAEVGENTYEDIANVIMVPSQGKQVGLGLAPFLPYIEETKLTIDSRHVIVKGTPTKEMINNYSRIFGSGIQIASSIPGLQ